MSAEPELVILVDEDGTPTGSFEKFAVHTADTPLHLAFSCHVYNEAGQVLVTRRALGKLTWPGVWTNSFCGHPAPGESLEDALSRRARLELGITISNVTSLLPGFRYRAVDASGIVENEICPVFRAVTTDAVAANPDEVAEWAWTDPGALAKAVTATPFAFSPWLALQQAELSA
ncbi:MAG TPA: isopentenyl-diphosphate Delta-isomerase [Terrimesophilobacter sp.]|nr:isopentenyl-diphosphate Delta-isomerase [Terrimesophilobacter sp.]